MLVDHHRLRLLHRHHLRLQRLPLQVLPHVVDVLIQSYDLVEKFLDAGIQDVSTSISIVHDLIEI